MKKLCFLIILLVNSGIFAQSFSFGWLPKVNVSSSLNKSLKLVNSIESRASIYNQEFNIKHSLIDISSILSIKTSLDQSFNIGYVVRFKNKEVIHRLVQHFNLVQQLNTIKLGHRLGFEQFFQNQEEPQYRLRYRATFQKALNGEKVDIKEWYLKFGNEYLYQFNKEDLEVRITPYLGYQLSKNDKLEFGLDYRLGKFINDKPSNNIWFRTTWYISF